MTPVSGVNAGAVQPLTTAGKVLGASKVQKPGEESQDRQPKPVMDEYVPEEPREPSGRYWMGKGEDGQPRIYFDDPERAPAAGKPEADAPEAEEPVPANRGGKGPERKKDQDEVWAGNTDKVDREIERLKKKREELEQRINRETDEVRIEALKRQLDQVERELREKDNDTYRRQHSMFTRLP